MPDRITKSDRDVAAEFTYHDDEPIPAAHLIERRFAQAAAKARRLERERIERVATELFSPLVSTVLKAALAALEDKQGGNDHG